MSDNTFRKLTGILLIAGAVLINIPYTLLIAKFDYPDILRMPIEDILTKFQAGGSSLIYIWFTFAWVGLPLLFGILMLKRILEKENAPFLTVATSLGVVAFVVQMVGLLRWVFVVPLLARLFTDPTTNSVTRAVIPVVFVTVHQYGGVILGEHLGQLFTIIWMALISAIIYNSPLFSKWVAWLGWIASAIYLLAQTELLATAIPEFPSFDWAGLFGSLLWLLWIAIMGVYLVRSKEI